jgi:hypothetical protein
VSVAIVTGSVNGTNGKGISLAFILVLVIDVLLKVPLPVI